MVDDIVYSTGMLQYLYECMVCAVRLVDEAILVMHFIARTSTSMCNNHTMEKRVRLVCLVLHF